MIDVVQVKEGIINFLKENGPSLPLKIAKHVNLSPIFATAILAELSNEKRVKLSNLKIGSSSLYLLPEQDILLENFSDEMRGPKKEAFLKLKENKILEDETQTPLMKVALRSIKDFAIPIKINEKIFWKYLSVSNEEIKRILSKGMTNQKPLTEREQKEQVREVLRENLRQKSLGQKIWEDIEKEKKKEEIIQEIEKISEEIEEMQEKEDAETLRLSQPSPIISTPPLLPPTKKIETIVQERVEITLSKPTQIETSHEERKKKEEKKAKEEKPKLREEQKELPHLETNVEPNNESKPTIKSDKVLEFLEQIKSYLAKRKIDFLEETSLDKKEITAFVRINSDLGSLKMLVVAKNKKRIADKDIQDAYKKAISEKMPCILLSFGDITKKTRDFLQQYKDLIKVEKIE